MSVTGCLQQLKPFSSCEQESKVTDAAQSPQEDVRGDHSGEASLKWGDDGRCHSRYCLGSERGLLLTMIVHRCSGRNTSMYKYS